MDIIKKNKERLQKNKKHQYRHEPYKIFVKMQRLVDFEKTIQRLEKNRLDDSSIGIKSFLVFKQKYEKFFIECTSQ